MPAADAAKRNDEGDDELPPWLASAEAILQDQAPHDNTAGDTAASDECTSPSIACHTSEVPATSNHGRDIDHHVPFTPKRRLTEQSAIAAGGGTATLASAPTVLSKLKCVTRSWAGVWQRAPPIVRYGLAIAAFLTLAIAA